MESPDTIGRFPSGISVDTLHAFAQEPWQNGAGVTRTLATGSFGPNANRGRNGDWDWRLSLAEIATDCEFSVLPGIDRLAALVSGAGLILASEEGAALEFGKPGTVHAFAGDTRLTSRLGDGPARLCNLMTRRGRARARMSAEHSCGKVMAVADCHVLLATGRFRVTVSDGGLPFALELELRDGDVLQVRRSGVLLAWDSFGEHDLLIVSTIQGERSSD